MNALVSSFDGRSRARAGIGRSALAVAVLVVAACGAPHVAPAAPLTQEQRVQQASASTVLVVGSYGSESRGGSGVILDATRGWVITNAHVVTGTSSLKVTLDDGRTVPARILGQAPCDDLAVLVLNPVPSDLHAITFGDSGKVRAGQHVTVLGYPASFQAGAQAKVTATEGSVSVADVAAEPDGSLPRYPSLIQHQAPVNPGNSGGPLIDDSAKLIGINTLANTVTPGGRAIQGQYYAITTRHVKDVLQTLEAGKNIAYVGWELLPVSEYGDLVESNTGITLPRTDGLYVAAVDSGSPADKGNIDVADQIYNIEDTPVNSVADVCGIIQSRSSGQVVRVHGVYTHGSKYSEAWFADVTL